MTVSSSTNKSGPYTGNGSTTVFAYGFKIDDEDELRVVQTVGGVDTDLTSGFSVSGVGEDGGNVTFDTAPASSAMITLIRDVPFTQGSDYSNQGSVPPETIEADLDRAVMRDQQLAERLDRVLQLPLSSTASGELPELVAGRPLVVNSDASGFELSSLPSAVDASIYASRASAAAVVDATIDYAFVAGEGLFQRVGSEPGHANKFQGTDDTWFELASVDASYLAGISAFALARLAETTAAAWRTALDLEPGTDVQAYHANLAALAGLSLVADRLPYANGTGTLALAPLTAFGRTLAALADAAAARTAIGLAVYPFAAIRFNGTGTAAVSYSAGMHATTPLIDNSTGNYTVQFDEAEPDANYYPCFAAATASTFFVEVSKTTTAYRFECVNSAGTPVDRDGLTVTFFR